MNQPFILFACIDTIIMNQYCNQTFNVGLTDHDTDNDNIYFYKTFPSTENGEINNKISFDSKDERDSQHVLIIEVQVQQYGDWIGVQTLVYLQWSSTSNAK